MLIPTIVMAVLAAALLIYGYTRGQGEHITAIREAAIMAVRMVPLLLCAFIVASMVQQLLPKELLARWIGESSGLRGIFIGTLAGGLAPGGPYVSLPLAAGLIRSGASIGTMVAFLTGWSLWAFSRLPMEIGILGWKLTLIRFTCTFLFPPLAGLLARVLFESPR
jgi:uncharacterized membrane protein YraQ (UPF0718 family)